MDKKFEYMAVDASDFPSPEQLTEIYGKDGWQIIQMLPRNGAFTIYFMREMQQA